MDAFLSFIALWPLKWPPRNWAVCWGQIITVTENPMLFSLIGTRYGGDGQNTFFLPDYRGRVPVGVSTGPGLLPYPSIGGLGGVESVVLVPDQMAAHKHAASLSAISIEVKASNQKGTETVPGENGANTLGASSAGFQPGKLVYNTKTPKVALDGFSFSGGDVALQSTGGGRAHSNIQPFITINYIMCMDGIFPSRQ